MFSCDSVKRDGMGGGERYDACADEWVAGEWAPTKSSWRRAPA